MEVLPFRSRDQLDKEQLKKDLCDFIDNGDLIVIISHRDEENVTDLGTNLNFETDRVGIKGLLTEASEIVFRLSPPKVYHGDVEI